MSDPQSRTASDGLYDHEREDPRSGRRRRPVADWGVGEDMFEHIPRNRFSRAAEGPPRDRRFSRAAEADRRAAGERSDDVSSRDDSEGAVDDAPRAWTGPDRDMTHETDSPESARAESAYESADRRRVAAIDDTSERR